MTDHLTPINPRDILLLKAADIGTQGSDEEAKGNLDEAYALYQRSYEIMLGLINNEPDTKMKVSIAMRMKVALEKISEVKERIDSAPKEAPPPPSIDQTTDFAFVVILSVENVSIYEISGAGATSQDKRLLCSGTLRILRCHETDVSLLQLQSAAADQSQFQFPLTKQVPCLGTAPGYYIFPMPNNNFYGVVFPKEIPAPYLSVFEQQLDDLCLLRRLPSFQDSPIVNKEEQAVMAVAPKLDDKQVVVPDEVPALPFTVKALNLVTYGIDTGAKYLVTGIEVGSQYLNSGTHKGGDYLKTKITPTAEPVHVPMKIASSIYLAGKISPLAVGVSKALVNSLASLAAEIGSVVAEGIVSNTPYLNTIHKKPDTATTVAAKEVGKSGLQAFVNVWDALEMAGRSLLRETSTASVGLIEQRYGKEVAQVTSDSLAVAGNLLETIYNVEQVGMRKLASKTARQASRQTVQRALGVEPARPATTTPALTLTDGLTLAANLLTYAPR